MAPPSWSFLFLPFGHRMYQTCCHVLHSQLLHQHDLQGGDQVFVERWQILEQNYHNIFIYHEYLQASKQTDPQVP